jgi:hypothetical protein
MVKNCTALWLGPTRPPAPLPRASHRSKAGAGLPPSLLGQAPPPFLARRVASLLRSSPTSARQYKRVAPHVVAPFFPPFLFPPIRECLEPPPLLPYLLSTAGRQSAATAADSPLRGELTLSVITVLLRRPCLIPCDPSCCRSTSRPSPTIGAHHRRGNAATLNRFSASPPSASTVSPANHHHARRHPGDPLVLIGHTLSLAHRHRVIGERAPTVW